jgi:hypothetical protein
MFRLWGKNFILMGFIDIVMETWERNDITHEDEKN